MGRRGWEKQKIAPPLGTITLLPECLSDSADILNIHRARQPAMQHRSSLSMPRALWPRCMPSRDGSPTRYRDPSDCQSRVARIQLVMRAEEKAGHAVPPLFYVPFGPPVGVSLQPAARLVLNGPDFTFYGIARPGEPHGEFP